MKDDLGKNNAWVTYINPFRLVVPDTEAPLKVDLEEINSNTYDHGKLCRIVTAVDLPDTEDYKLLICYDGALAIPRTGPYRKKEDAVNLFNRIICQLQLAGVMCEAIDQRDVVWGKLHEKILIWPVDLGESASSHLHSKLRMRVASNIDTIILSSPKHINVNHLLSSLSQGENILKIIDNLTPTFLARGITEIRYKNWSLALSNLWITVEQLTDHLWDSKFITNSSMHPDSEISGRIKAMKQDNRTWSSSVKQEMLFQVGVFDSFVFERLYPARQSRNRLVHDGKEVSEVIVMNLYTAIVKLICICLGKSNLPMTELNLARERAVGKKLDVQENFEDWRDVSDGHNAT
ncbi:hypothetical protein V2I78_19765 [Pseudomonas viridiflava]|uniref:hypothetical protein n=1 Tax=Pseudomonas viridiflava TaxID=33069 RepID=UPI002E992F65|nr:hypothetical protein [Pseudomonas viridiflava]